VISAVLKSVGHWITPKLACGDNDSLRAPFSGELAPTGSGRCGSFERSNASTSLLHVRLVEHPTGDVRVSKKAKPKPPLSGTVRLLNKHEVCAVAAVSYPTIWAWMRRGEFPRSRVCGGKSMWLSTEIEQWLAALPVRKLKGDKQEAAA
jgi:predicted DNA-binding transcriptional regulator AlpA